MNFAEGDGPELDRFLDDVFEETPSEIATRLLFEFLAREPFVAAKIGNAGLTRHVKELVIDGVIAGLQAAQEAPRGGLG